MAFTKIIGLDLGHGETAAVCMSADTKQINILNLDDNQTKVIPSVLGIREDGTTALGRNAGEGLDIQKVIAYFKRSPDHFEEKVMGLTRRECITLFVKQLFMQIFRYNRDVLTESDKENIQLIVGCPSTAEWTGAENKEKYEMLLREASGFQNVSVVPESRAALFSVFTNQGMEGITATDGVLVFDFGSSTADCTYISMGRLLMEYSWTLGASVIEELMLEEMQKALYREAQARGVHASFSNVSGIEFALRVDYKEKYYSRKLPEDACYVRRAGVVDEFGAPVLNEAKKQKSFKVDLDINRELMKTITTDIPFFVSKGAARQKVKGSWYDHCKGFLEQAREEISSRQLPCGAIMLTGGASKMHFIEELCQSVFSDSKMKILISGDRSSFSVALGLAWTGMVDAQIETKKKEALNKLKMTYACGKDALADSIADAYTSVLSVYFEEALDEWANSDKDQTIDELDKNFHNKCKGEEVQGKLDGAVEKGMSDWLRACSEKVQAIAIEKVSGIYGQEMALNLGLLDDFAKRFSSDHKPPVTLPAVDVTEAVKKSGNLARNLIDAYFRQNVTVILLKKLLPWAFKDDSLLPAKKRQKYLQKQKSDKLVKNLKKQIKAGLKEQLENTNEEILIPMMDQMMDILALRQFKETLFL